MADIAQKSRPSPYSQTICLNAVVIALLVAAVWQPSWQSVIALIAGLGALSFRWTREDVAAHETKRIDDLTEQLRELSKKAGEMKRVDEIAEQVKLLSMRLGNLAFKTGFKEK